VKPVLDAKFAALARDLQARVDDLADALLGRARAELSEWLVERPEVSEYVDALTRRSILAELQAFERGRLPDRCPQVDLEGARNAAQLSTDVSALVGLVDGYRRGHLVQWEGWFALVDERVGDPAERRALLERGWRFFFDYAGLMAGFVTDEYMHERDRMLRGREQRRVSLVRELLAGANVDAGELDYDVDRQHHIAAIAWGRAAVDALRTLAHDLDRRLLLVGVIEDTWWGWLGGREPVEHEATAVRRIHRLSPSVDASVALGAEGHGREGFRESHRQARRAHWAAHARGASLTRYEDIALESLAAHDEAEARQFVARELWGLDGADARSGRLRETLCAYFGAGQNAAAAAAALGVHEQTVAARLRTVERRTGRPVAARRAELETALRLRAVLPA
jgi:hypothetical protein